MSVIIVASGDQAREKAQQLLKECSDVVGTSSYGAAVKIPVGTIDLASDTVIIGTLATHVFYLNGNDLKALPRQSFVQNYAVGDLSKQVYDKTKWIVPVANTMAEFMMAFGCAIAGPLGLAATLTVMVVKGAVFYDKNKRACDLAISHLDELLTALLWIREHCPETYAALIKILGHGFGEAVAAIPSGFNAKTTAKLLGACLGGVFKAPTFVLGKAATAIAISLGTNAPGLAFAGISSSSKVVAEDLIKGFEATGIMIGSSQARQMAWELERPDALSRLADFNRAALAFSTILEELTEAWEKAS